MGTCATNEENATESKHWRRKDFEYRRQSQTFSEDNLKQTVLECFDKFDKNRDGFLDFFETAELVKATYAKCSQIERSSEFYLGATRKLFLAADQMGEGRISRENFYRFYKTH